MALALQTETVSVLPEKHYNSSRYVIVPSSKKFRQVSSTAVFFLLLSVRAIASDAIESNRLSFSGFGTLGYAATDSDTAEYRTGKAQDGADKKGSFEVDSRLGVQADFQFSRNSSATLQLLAREGEEGRPEVLPEWAFLKRQLNDSVSVRAGRIGLGIYMASEIREVGFAHPMLRPPEETYVQVPLYSFDGVDIIGHFDFGETHVSIQAIAGKRKMDFYDDLRVDMKLIVGFNIIAETDHWRWRITHNRGKLNVSSDDLLSLGQVIATLSAQFPQLAEVSADLDNEYKDASFTGFGVEYEQGNMFMHAELTGRSVNQYMPDTTGWYLAAGIHMGSFAPYAYVSQLRQTSKDSIDFPDIPDPDLQAVAAAVDNIYSSVDQQSIAAGFRWDFKPNIAFKAQVEHINFENSGINFARLGDEPRTGSDSVNLYSVVFDFIF